MKYNYELDALNRFTGFTKDREDLPEIEIDNIEDIIIGQHGLINGEIVFIGLTDDEKKAYDIFDKTNIIANLKDKLNSSDYQIIKSYEAQLSNEPMPYDLNELLAQRKMWREKINQLEFEIKMLG
jgi:predicted nucleotidyltransferase